MNAKTAAIQGSGWGWLGYDKSKGELEIITTANQDPLLSQFRLFFSACLTRAVALKYRERRINELTYHASSRTHHRHRYLGARFLPPVQERQARCECCASEASNPELTPSYQQYLKAIWSVINFEEAEARFKAAQ